MLKGSFILVSHDRYFISKVANKIWEIDNLKIKEFDGGYDEFVEWKKRMEEKQIIPVYILPKSLSLESLDTLAD